FVRPVHSLILLHGKQIIKGTVLGLKSGNTTQGHRFLSKGKIKITRAEQYEKMLEKSGKVIANFEERKNRIRVLIQAEQQKKPFALSANSNELLEEVTALIEYPKVYRGQFSKEFLTVPSECLSVSMQRHQKYFPIFDTQGKMLSEFLV